jgi:aspartyl/asparaginyl-tRNA synthetase
MTQDSTRYGSAVPEIGEIIGGSERESTTIN